MTDLVTVVGVVGSDPRHTVTATGLPITNFRLASTRRYFDRETGKWADGDTNWFTVASFRQLALNTARSLRKGERVVVHGRLRVRAWETGERSGTAIEIDADSIGHDLSWGVAVYTKTVGARAVDPAGEGAGVEREAEASVTASPDLDAAEADATWTTSGWPEEAANPAEVAAAVASDELEPDGVLA
ncbi:hypothetical protein GCM10009819_05020 [Agromyces tropicus]|uniref:Single-stranded DNA-binding protein n=1 Tax=Agromyces tropicus TaxID=555371 RepID=A0ABN2TYH2_9MICO